MCNEVEECGICLSGEAISRIRQTTFDSTMAETATDKQLPFSTAKETVDKYKTALKVIDIVESNKTYSLKETLEWLRNDVLDVNKSTFVIYGILWLFSNKSLENSTWLVFLCLLCNLDFYEIYRSICAIFVCYAQQKKLEDEVIAMGLDELLSEPFKREDLKLYMKVKNGNFRFK